MQTHHYAEGQRPTLWPGCCPW